MLGVFVDAPLKICEEHDVKGLYAKARQGIIKNFTGIDSPYEAPMNADIILKTAEESVSESCRRVLEKTLELKYSEKEIN